MVLVQTDLYHEAHVEAVGDYEVYVVTQHIGMASERDVFWESAQLYLIKHEDVFLLTTEKLRELIEEVKKGNDIKIILKQSYGV